MFSRMLKLPADVRAATDLSSLEVIIHTAPPCPVQLNRQMIERFGSIFLEYDKEGYLFLTDRKAHTIISGGVDTTGELHKGVPCKRGWADRDTRIA